MEHRRFDLIAFPHQWRIYIVKFWMRAPPGGPNSFNFMQFLGNFGEIVCWCPLLGEILDPPLHTTDYHTNQAVREKAYFIFSRLNMLPLYGLPGLPESGRDQA